MKGVDYSKQLARERDYMQDAVVKNRQAMEKRIDDIEKRNELAQGKQLDNHVRDRAELEKSHQKTIENIEEKTKAALDRKDENYRRRVEEARQSFKDTAETKSKDFDRRLSDIKNSYDRNERAESERHKMLEDSNKKSYNKNIKSLRENQDQQLAQYQEQMKGKGADLKEQYNRSREQMVRSHEDHVNDVRKGEVEKQNKLQEKVTRDIKLSNEKNEADIKQIQGYSDDKIKRINKYNNEQNENIARDYTQKVDTYATNQHKEAIRANKEADERASELQRKFDGQLRTMELEKRRRDNGSDEFQAVNQKQLGLKDQDMYQNKIDKLRTALKDTQKEYEQRTNADRKQYSETLEVESSEATMRKDRAVNNLNAEKIVQMAHEREKSQDMKNELQYINRLEKQASEHQIMHERKVGQERMDNLKENFNKAMTKMEEQMKVSIEDVTKMSNDDKAKFVKDLNSKRMQEVYNLKRDFNVEMDKTIQNYEQRLASAQRENELLKMTMDQKVGNIMDQTEKKLDAERTINSERRRSEKQDAQIALDQREHKLRTEMNTVIVNYQRKLDKMQIDNDTKMKLITNNYENRLKELNTLKGKELAQKETTHQVEVQRMKSAFEEEKNRLVAGYENQLAAIKASHEERMLQLDEFKKLS